MDDHAPLIERAFALPVAEASKADASLEGTLPAYVRGTCLLNGPGRFARGALRYRHWLDGDGFVAALELGAGPPRISARFVRSEKFVREEAEGRPIFRTFGTTFEGDELKRGIGLASPVNVSVYPFAGTLLAFGEQGLPWELDPATLETRGVFTFGGQLNEITPFSAHPKIDPRTGELFNFGVSFAAERPMLNLFRFAADGRLTYRRRFPLPYAASVHDFAIGSHHVAFYISPLILEMAALMRGRSLMDALSFRPELGSVLLIASRESGDLLASLPVGHGYCLHLVNAFERQEDGRLIVDLVEYDKPLYPEYQVVPDLFSDTFGGRPVRLAVDVAGSRILERQVVDYNCSPDFPAHDPRVTGLPYEHFWMLGISRSGRQGRKFFDQLVRIDWARRGVDVYEAPPLHYLGGEPIFIPDPAASGRGTVVCQQFDARQVVSRFAFFDAFDLAAGPRATVRLADAIPLLFHSTFIPHPERAMRPIAA